MGLFFDNKEDDAWRTASLRYIRDRIPFVGTTWPSQSEVDYAIPRIEAARVWAHAIADPRMRKECLRWCDHADHLVEEASKELRTKAKEIAQNEWREKNAKREIIVTEILKQFEQ